MQYRATTNQSISDQQTAITERDQRINPLTRGYVPTAVYQGKDKMIRAP